MVSITLPSKIEKRLREECERRGVSDEELILEALSEFLNIDPESKSEVHISLSEKYAREMDEFLEKGDYVQASEKAWEAASQILKAVASKRGKELKSHGELHKFVSELREETGDQELRRLWQVATSLHQNFYENWLPEGIVRESIEDVKRFVEKLRELCR